MSKVHRLLLTFLLLTLALPASYGQDSRQILFGEDADTAKDMNELSLRPNQESSFFVFVSNPTNDSLDATLTVTAKGNKKLFEAKVASTAKNLKIPVPLKLEKDLELGSIQELNFALTDNTRPDGDAKKSIVSKTLKLNVKSPSAYLDVKTSLDKDGRLLVEVATTSDFRGAPCKVQLDLSHLQNVSAGQEPNGVFLEELDGKEKKSVTLSCDRLKFDNKDNQGFFAINIDNVARAIAFTAKDMEPQGTPTKLGANTIRITAPKYCLSSEKTDLVLRFEVDEPEDLKSKVQMSLDLAGAGKFTVIDKDAYRREVVSLKKSDAALTLSPVVEDWTYTVKSAGREGKANFKATLFNSGGEKKNSDERSTTFSKQAPKISEVMIKEEKASYLPGDEVTVMVKADSPTDITTVTLFVGEQPPTDKDKPLALVLADKVWSRKIKLPDTPSKPKLFITARNGVGLASVHDDIVFKVAAPLPETTKDKLGSIKGLVVQGTEDRPQRELEVLLIDTKAVTKNTKTDDKGYFEFKDLPAGTYRVYCTRPSDKSKASVDVTLDAGQNVVLDNKQKDDKQRPLDKALHLKR